MTQRLWLLFSASLFCLFVSAQAVMPDPHFGNHGTISFFVDPISFENEFPVALAVQQNDKLMVAATAIDGEGYSGRATVHRFFSNGVIDSSFANGELRTGRGHGFNIAGMSVLPDGKIVTFTHTTYHTDDFNDTVWVERYLIDGGIDSTFGTYGATFFHRPFSYSSALEMVVKPGGKIVVRFTINNTEQHIAQLNESGKKDFSFGTNGNIIPSGYATDIRKMIALPNNQLLASAIYQKTDNTFGSCLIRYTANGNIDSSFGTNGVVFNNNTILVTVRSVELTLQADNKLLEYTEDNGNDVLLRYNADGTLDPSFGIGGKIVVEAINPNSYYVATGVRVQENGRILVSLAGSSSLKRYFPNGRVDSSFGTNGILTNNNLTTETTISFLPYKTKLIVSGTTLAMYNEQSVAVNVYVPCKTCTSTDVISQTVSAKNLVHPGITIYPNPVTSQLIIHGLNSSAINELTLINAAGQVIKRASIKGDTYQWNVQHLPTGVYQVSITSANLPPVSFSIVKQ